MYGTWVLYKLFGVLINDNGNWDEQAFVASWETTAEAATAKQNIQILRDQNGQLQEEFVQLRRWSSSWMSRAW